MEIAPSYWNEKRSMPLLPWLPASRKKRFPVTKRSPKASDNNERERASVAAIVENDKKIAQDLKGIFGVVNGNDEEDKKKKKRSMENNEKETKLEATRQQHSSMMAPHHSHENGEKKRSLKKRSPNNDGDNEEDDENGNFIEFFSLMHARLNINKTFFFLSHIFSFK